MPSTTINSPDRTVAIKTTTTIVSPDNPRLVQILDKLKLLEARLDLLKVEVKKDNVNPIKFRYTITLQDARLWKQNLYIPINGTEDYMNFNVNDSWLSSELEFHRELRLSIVLLVKFIPDLEDLIVNYLD